MASCERGYASGSIHFRYHNLDIVVQEPIKNNTLVGGEVLSLDFRKLTEGFNENN